jgi:hypothetical protein
MEHYPSQYIITKMRVKYHQRAYFTHMVFALYAQYRVEAECDEFMGDRNGIRQPFHMFVSLSNFDLF